jgi:NitT/TauT family transport system ATP-binding protein
MYNSQLPQKTSTGFLTSASPDSRPAIEIENVVQKFPVKGGGVKTALTDVSFSIEESSFVAVVGPSGCGKSTLLNLISGLLMPTAGSVKVKGKVVSGVRHDVGYMPSQDSLLPWRDVLGNVAYPLELRGIPKAERTERAREMIAAVGLSKAESFYPHALSHGMRQRVAIARTFAADSDIVLMDEPFSALDAQTRMKVQDLFMSIWERKNPTVVLITHDVAEAVALADRVVSITGAPGTVQSVHEINIQRPRTVEDLIFDSVEFQNHMRIIWDDLKTTGEDK